MTRPAYRKDPVSGPFQNIRRMIPLLLLGAVLANGVETGGPAPNLDEPAKDADVIIRELRIDESIILVSWELRDERVAVHQYRVKLIVWGKVLQIAIIEGKSEYMFFRVPPCSDFQVYVQPEDREGNDAGIGTTKKGQTLEAAPPAVRHLSATLITARSIEFSWEEPFTMCGLDDYTGMTFTGHILRNSEFIDVIKRLVPCSDYTVEFTSDNTMRIEKLQPNTDYTFTVFANNDAGYGEPAFIEVTTTSEVPKHDEM